MLWLTSPAAVLVLSLLKASLVLALAQCVVWAIPRMSAAAKHLLLTAGLAAFLVIPLFAGFGPSWRFTVETPPVPAAISVDATGDLSLPLETATPTRAFGLEEAGALLWLLGMLAVLGHLLRSARRVRSIVAEAVPPSARAIALLEETRRLLSLDATVRLLQSDRIYVPMVWGVRSGTLLLPQVAEEWTEEHLRATFIHELGHLQRLDYVSLALMNLVTTLLWFHPQVWLARRQALSEGERACDDLVLRAGECPSAYATHLLHVAGMTPRREPLPALLAMSRPSQLEGRMVSILSTSINRQAIGGKRFMISLASFIAVVVPFSLMQITAEPAVAAARSVAARPSAVVEAVAPAVVAQPAPSVAATVVATEPAQPAQEAEPVPETSTSEPVTLSTSKVAEVEVESVSAVAEASPVEAVAPTTVQPAAQPAVMQIFSEVDLASRPFQVVGKVRGRACTLKLLRPTNTSDATNNPAQALAMKRMMQSAATKGASGVTNLRCMREIGIGLSCPTAVVCEGQAIQFQ